MIDLASTALGRVAVDGRALDRLVRSAAERVDGVESILPRSGVRIAVDAERGVLVTIGIVARWGIVLQELGRRVQERVREVVATTLEPSSVRVDVVIEEIGD